MVDAFNVPSTISVRFVSVTKSGSSICPIEDPEIFIKLSIITEDPSAGIISRLPLLDNKKLAFRIPSSRKSVKFVSSV